MEANYKKPLAFHTNHYATFLKRNAELLNENGKIGMVTPMTFMYIKKFEDMRKFILDNFYINIFVEYGLTDRGIVVYSAFYVIEKGSYSDRPVVFISMTQYNCTPEENFQQQYTQTALKNYIQGLPDKNLSCCEQSKFMLIDSYPFIYWISDNFREMFGKDLLSTCANFRLLR